MIHRVDVIREIMKKRLVERCIAYQTHGIERYLKEELTQELWVWLHTYDWEKLRDAYENKHINRLITVWIMRNYRSGTSPFFNRYRKRQRGEVTINEEVLQIPDPDTL